MRWRLAVALVLYAAFSLLVAGSEVITVCSFNIKWLGYYTDKDYKTLAELLAPYDVITIQETVAPPYRGTFPDGEPYRPDPQVTEFFDEMTQVQGYRYVLSREDTGPGSTNHTNSSRTEWFALFYRPERLAPATHLPTGYIASDVTANSTFDRVPYVFSLKYRPTGFDFALISVHLHAGTRSVDAHKRRAELDAIAAWISAQPSAEEQYIVLGDMNFSNCSEIEASVPDGLSFLNPSLSGVCRSTNVGSSHGHPYDDVIYTPAAPVDLGYGLAVVDLIAEVSLASSPFTASTRGALTGVDFAECYSDHNPVVFQLQVPPTDTD